MRTRRRLRRGITLIETMLAGAFTLLFMVLFAMYSTLGSRLLSFGLSDTGAQAGAQKALQIVARDVRAARGMVSVSTDYSDMTLQLPAYDTGGNLVLPITDGHTVRFRVTNGQLTRQESGSTARVLLKTLGTGGVFTMIPTFVDKNGDSINQASEACAVRTRLAVNERVFGSVKVDRGYDSRVTVYLHNRTAGEAPTTSTTPIPGSPSQPYPASPGEQDE